MCCRIDGQIKQGGNHQGTAKERGRNGQGEIGGRAEAVAEGRGGAGGGEREEAGACIGGKDRGRGGKQRVHTMGGRRQGAGGEEGREGPDKERRGGREGETEESAGEPKRNGRGGDRGVEGSCGGVRLATCGRGSRRLFSPNPTQSWPSPRWSTRLPAPWTSGSSSACRWGGTPAPAPCTLRGPRGLRSRSRGR